MKFNLEDHAKFLQTHAPASYAAGTELSKVIDTIDFDELMLQLNAGVLGASATVAVTLEESEDGATGWTAIAGAAINLTQAAGDGDQAYLGRLNLREINERYVRVSIVIATAACFLSSLTILSNARKKPPVQEDGTSAAPGDFAATTVSFSV